MAVTKITYIINKLNPRNNVNVDRISDMKFINE